MTTMEAGWNGVAGDSRSFRRKPMEFGEAICGGAEKIGAFGGDSKLGCEQENVSERVVSKVCVCVMDR
jgi:hypothetical protein